MVEETTLEPVVQDAVDGRRNVLEQRFVTESSTDNLAPTSQLSQDYSQVIPQPGVDVHLLFAEVSHSPLRSGIVHTARARLCARARAQPCRSHTYTPHVHYSPSVWADARVYGWNVRACTVYV